MEGENGRGREKRKSQTLQFALGGGLYDKQSPTIHPYLICRIASREGGINTLVLSPAHEYILTL
jgi:hypothetical protein